MLNSAYNALGYGARDMLNHYACGEMYTWRNQCDGELGWIKTPHRGVLMMHALHIGHTVKKCLARNEFEFRYNTAFNQVVTQCGDLGREGKTWITPELAAAYADLHRNGYAYSCEAWLDGKLAGGLFGVQIGGFISIDSMFHRSNNAGKAVFGHHTLNLRQRGFLFADVNYGSAHTQRFGAEWVPQWQFEKMMRPVLHSKLKLIENRPVPMLPWRVLAAERGVQIIRSVRQQLKRYLMRQPESVVAVAGATAA